MTEQKFSLDEQIEEDKKLLAGEEEPDKEENEEEEEGEAESKEDGDGAVEKEPAKEEPAKEEPKADPKPVVDHAALAQARFENSELKRRIAEQQKQPEPKKEVEKVPDPTEDPLGYLAHENRKLKEQVESVAKWKEEQDASKKQQDFYAAQVRGFNVAEEQFKSTVPDYEEVSNHMVSEMKTAFKRLYPTASQQQIDGAVANKIIEMAEQAAQRGEQPVGYLYNLSKTVYGYQPKAQDEPAKEEKPKKPDLAVIDRNKKKAAHGLGGQGSKGTITPEDYANMSIADMEKYGPEFYQSFRA